MKKIGLGMMNEKILKFDSTVDITSTEFESYWCVLFAAICRPSSAGEDWVKVWTAGATSNMHRSRRALYSLFESADIKIHVEIESVYSEYYRKMEDVDLDVEFLGFTIKDIEVISHDDDGVFEKNAKHLLSFDKEVYNCLKKLTHELIREKWHYRYKQNAFDKLPEPLE